MEFLVAFLFSMPRKYLEFFSPSSCQAVLERTIRPSIFGFLALSNSSDAARNARSSVSALVLKKVVCAFSTLTINPRPAGPLDFPPPAGGGGGAFERPPP